MSRYFDPNATTTRHPVPPEPGTDSKTVSRCRNTAFCARGSLWRLTFVPITINHTFVTPSFNFTRKHFCPDIFSLIRPATRVSLLERQHSTFGRFPAARGHSGAGSRIRGVLGTSFLQLSSRIAQSFQFHSINSHLCPVTFPFRGPVGGSATRSSF